MLDECSRPHTWGGTRRRYPRLEPIQQAPPIHVYHQQPPEQPRIIQHPVSLKEQNSILVASINKNSVKKIRIGYETSFIYKKSNLGCTALEPHA